MLRVEVFSKDYVHKVNEFQAGVVTIMDGVLTLECVDLGGLVSKTIKDQNNYMVHITST